MEYLIYFGYFGATYLALLVISALLAYQYPWEEKTTFGNERQLFGTWVLFVLVSPILVPLNRRKT